MKPHLDSYLRVKNRAEVVRFVSAILTVSVQQPWLSMWHREYVKVSKSVGVRCGSVLLRLRRWQIAASKSQLPSSLEGFPSITVPVVCLRFPKLPPLQQQQPLFFSYRDL